MIRSAAAGASAGVALWCSLGVLDRVATPQGGVRVAMLPPWWMLAALMIAGAVTTAVWTRQPSSSLERSTRTLPLFGLLVLVLPYLPLFADRWPAAHVLAGPGRWLVWVVVMTPVVLRLVPATVVTSARMAVGRFEEPTRGTIASFAAGVVIFGAVAARVTGSEYFPGGDEPHYLIITQSLLRDGDLKIENNHRRGDYGEYFFANLDPHFLSRGVDGEIYSIHPVGLPILAVPAYALAGYRGVVAAIVIAGAAAGALLWRWVYVATVSASAAWFAWAATALAAPFAFQSVAIYPEVPAAVAVMLALAWPTRPPRDAGIVEPPDEPTSLGHAVARAAAASVLPWLSTKYAPLSVAIMCVLLWRVWTGTRDPRARLKRLAVSAMPYALSLVSWFAFFYWIWGTPSPSAPYGTYTQTRLAHIRVGGPGLLFDQEYGIVPYAPVLIAGLTGLLILITLRRGAARRLGIELAVVMGALLGSVGAFRIWWGGSAAPGRPLASGLLLLGVPIAFGYVHAAGNRGLRAAYHALLILGLSVTALMAGVGHGALSTNGRDGSSTLLEWLSPSWPAWRVVPTYIGTADTIADLLSLIWIAAAIIGAAILARVARTATQPLAELHSFLTIVVATLAVTTIAPIVVPAVPTSASADRALEARARVPLLDGFDASRRPVSIVYDPFRLVPPESIPPLVSLVASPSIERPVPPAPVLFNGRFALPAGDYEVTITTNAPVTPLSVLAMKTGAAGSPLDVWPVAGATPGTWRQRFSLPIDVDFVGFTASDGLASVIDELRVSPVRVVDASRRHPSPRVVAAARYGGATVYFHTEPAWPEPSGFWTLGRMTTRFTIAAASAPRLRLRAGAGGNTITVATPHERTTVTLAAGEAQDLPPIEGGTHPASDPILVSVTTASGFRPKEVEPNSRDQRFLGCWVELR